MTTKYLACIISWIMVPFKESRNIGTVAVWGGKGENWVTWQCIEFHDQWTGPVENDWWI